MLLEFLILSVVALYLFYRWVTANNDFFEKRGIPYHKPFPIFGSMKDMVFRKKSIFDVVVELYEMSDDKVFGVFDQRNPLFLLRDPELIKQITVKDFDHFVNHRQIFESDPDDAVNLFGSSLFLMKDTKWKDMRSTLSPAFTGSKMRQMFQLMNKVAQETAEKLKRDHRSKESFDLDMKDYTTRFTNDIIASTAFGVEVNSFEDKDNKFYRMGKKVTNFSAWQNIKFFLFAHMRSLMKLLKVSVFDKESSDFFMHLVLDAMKYRKEHSITRPDMINLLMEARGLIKSDNPKPNNREWSDVEIVAQCFLFFFAGFETASVLMCFAAHELMENPEVQQKLLEEIEEVSQELNGGPLTYEALMGMKYMDMVTSETLRKWPGAIAIDRVCSKDYTYKTDELRFEIKKGESVWIPVCGFHRDPKYFENPAKFEPERFSEENKDNIVPFTYLPFGVGPRNCIGSRYALLEAKALLFFLVREFSLEAAEKSTVPMVLSGKKGFTLAPEKGFWLKLTPRTKV